VLDYIHNKTFLQNPFFSPPFLQIRNQKDSPADSEKTY